MKSYNIWLIIIRWKKKTQAQLINVATDSPIYERIISHFVCFNNKKKAHTFYDAHETFEAIL